MEFGNIGFSGEVVVVKLYLARVAHSGGGKTGLSGEKPSEQGKNQQQTQPTYDTGPESNPGHMFYLFFSKTTTRQPERHFFVQNIIYLEINSHFVFSLFILHTALKAR